MEKKILVAYASKYGATKEISEKIGEVLRQAGLQVQVVPVDRVRDLTPYHAVILGSAVFVGKWPKEAAAFLKANEKNLASRPVWLFTSGPTGAGDPVELLEGWRLPTDLQPVADRIRPRDIAVFHGNINLEKLSFIDKAMIKAVKKPTGDYRNWEMIINWAQKIAGSLN